MEVLPKELISLKATQNTMPYELLRMTTDFLSSWMIQHFLVHHWSMENCRQGYSFLSHGLQIVDNNWPHQQRTWQGHRSNSPHQFCHILQWAHIQIREEQFSRQIIKSWQSPTKVDVVPHTLRIMTQIGNYN